MYCKKCGQEVGEFDDIYCPHCMNKVVQSTDIDETGEYISKTNLGDLLNDVNEEYQRARFTINLEEKFEIENSEEVFEYKEEISYLEEESVVDLLNEESVIDLLNEDEEDSKKEKIKLDLFNQEEIEEESVADLLDEESAIHILNENEENSKKEKIKIDLFGKKDEDFEESIKLLDEESVIDLLNEDEEDSKKEKIKIDLFSINNNEEDNIIEDDLTDQGMESINKIAIAKENHDISQIEDYRKGDMNKDYQEYKDNIFNRKNAFDDSYDYLNGNDNESGVKSKLLVLLIIIAFLVAVGIAVKFLLIDEGKLDLQELMQDFLPKKAEKVNDEVETPKEDADDKAEDEDIPETPVEVEDIHSREYILKNIDKVNENILEVKYNDSLVLGTKSYTTKDINTSVPLIDGVWKQVDGIDLYYEETIIKALVRFNSKWNDYVNENDKTVISLVEKDSRAYKNVISFRKKDKVQEFLIFEIGEIRKGKDGYYVWTHEKIKEIENGKDTIKEYYWIYKLVEGEYDFFISNYYTM